MPEARLARWSNSRMDATLAVRIALCRTCGGRDEAPGLEDVLAEIQSLADRGFQEIVLTGIHLGAFGLKLKDHPRLIDLLRRIVEIPRLGRIRLSSIEPMHFDRAIVDLAAEHPVFAHHFHIPLQSGSDRVLRLMRRPYTAARFRELLAYIQRQCPMQASEPMS